MSSARSRASLDHEAERARRERDALDTAVRSIAGVLDLEPVLQMIVDRVRDLADAEYAALGIIDEDGLLERFVTSGVTEARRRPIGAYLRSRVLGLISGKVNRFEFPTSANPRRQGSLVTTLHAQFSAYRSCGGAAIGNSISPTNGTNEFSAEDHTSSSASRWQRDIAIATPVCIAQVSGWRCSRAVRRAGPQRGRDPRRTR